MVPLNPCNSFPMALEEWLVYLPISCATVLSWDLHSVCSIHLGMWHLFCTAVRPKLTLRLALYLGKSHSKIDHACGKGKRFRSSTSRLLHHTVSSWSSRRYLQIYFGWMWEMTLSGSLMSHEFSMAARPWVFNSPEVLCCSGAGCF